jgi:hypothetical protein
MASTGQAAWTKYFQGKGDIQTVMKKDSIMYDAEKGIKKIADVPAGTPVVYVSTKSYESKALINCTINRKKFSGRVTFDNIAKPNVKSSGAASLKPQAFNVGETKYSFSTYKNTVLASINDRKDLSGPVRSYLEALFNYYSGTNSSTQTVTKIFKGSDGSLPLNDINKDFGEVLGPIAILQLGLLRTKNINLPRNSAKIYVPSRPNEPLMDYALIDGDTQYTISAKSGTTTNVVKPADIISLLSKNPKKLKKWTSKKEFQLLQTLADNNALTGPIKAVARFNPDMLSEKAANSVTKDSYDEKAFAPFFAKNAYLKLKKKPTVNEIMYECEKILQTQTKDGTFNMTEIFSDAIENQVIYVKFSIDIRTGLADWDVISSDDIRKVKSGAPVYLRSKNGYTRASDKMGIQV